MTDEASLSDPESAGSSRPTTGGAWEEVLELTGSLSDAVVRWSTAAAVGRAARTDLGHVAEAGAEQAGKAIWATAQQASEAAAPYASIVFAGLSDILGKVADRVDGAVSTQQAASAEGGRPAARATAPSPSEGAPSPGDERLAGA